MPPKRQNKKNAALAKTESVKSLEASLKEKGIHVDLNDLMKNGGLDLIKSLVALLKAKGKDVNWNDFVNDDGFELTNEERAQDLFYEAMEARSEKRTHALIQQALELDPDNVDARLWMLRTSDAKTGGRVEALREIMEVAVRKLGAKTFREAAGSFWGFIETRPYMRVREQLVGALLDAGRMEEAVAECEGMLELNPNDNQGIRYTLLTCYLSLNRQAEARRLSKQYDEDSVTFVWGKVLLCWLSTSKAGLGKALAAARKANAHVEGYLTGKKKLPKKMPPHYSMGSKEEAVCYAESLIQAWGCHPEALDWLREQVAENGK